MDEDVNAIKYYDNKGNQIDPDTGKIIKAVASNSESTGWIGSVVGAIGPIISALFPNGIGGNSSSNYPVVTTTPNGNTNVNLASSSNLLIYALLAMVAFFLFTSRSPMQPAKKK